MRRTTFRQFQQIKAEDLTNQGEFQQSYDGTLIRQGIGDGRYYAGLLVTLFGVTEVRVASGRFYDAGKIYSREESSLGGIQATTFSIYEFLPTEKKRVVAVMVSGSLVDKETQPRDFLTNVATEETEPDAVATVREQLASISLSGGAPAVNPLPPIIPSDRLHIANITVNTTSILSVEMITANLLPSISGNAQDLRLLRGSLDRSLATLAFLKSRLAGVKAELALTVNRDKTFALASAFARVAERLGLPDTFTNYAADFFVSDDESEISQPGYAADIFNGLLFPRVATATANLDLLNPSDPLVVKSNEGLILPRYTEEVLWDSGLDFYTGGALTIAYQSQTFTTQKVKLAQWQHAQGENYNTWLEWWQGNYGYDIDTLNPTPPHHTDEPTGVLGSKDYKIYTGKFTREWLNSWTLNDTEQIVAVAATEESTGALVAQTFITGRSMWATAVNLYFAELDASGDIEVMVCRTEEGRPLLDGVMAKTTITYDELQLNPENTPVAIPPVFLNGGDRYAIAIITSGQHKLATISGEKLTEGDLLFSTDGVFFTADITRDILFSLSGAQFEQNYVAVPLKAISLAGGMDSIRIQAQAYVPSGGQLSYEVQKSGQWFPLNVENSVFQSLPNILPLRAVMSGTSTIMPAIVATPNAIRGSRIGVAIEHYSTLRALATASDNIQVTVIAHRFDPLLHTIGCQIVETDDTERSPATTISRNDGGESGEELTYTTFTFALPTAITQYRIKITGTRATDGTTPFSIIERIDVAQ